MLRSVSCSTRASQYNLRWQVVSESYPPMAAANEEAQYQQRRPDQKIEVACSEALHAIYSQDFLMMIERVNAIASPSVNWFALATILHSNLWVRAEGACAVDVSSNIGVSWIVPYEYHSLGSVIPQSRKTGTVYTANGATANMKVETVIRVRDVIGSEFCISFRDGQRIFELIRDTISKGKRVTISFENIKSLSAAFLESAIGQLYLSGIPESKLKADITLEGVSPERKLLIERAISEAKESKVVS
jgi:hypothetical protein